ncbi:MAG TPA: homoserine O-acetyltransferase [Solirubrobacteraceae bacterium]|nr:homoserine O-acetyltransferase [Solirubrobacteraceae bacterium]
MARSLGTVATQRVVLFTEDDPLVLESGATLGPVEVAYETYGTLNDDRSNAVVVCHALTGDAHAAGRHEGASRPGWWDTIIGPGKPVDTDRLFVVCANILGGCRGTTGPASPDPRTGRPYGLRFPLFTVRDIVALQRALVVGHLGVARPLAAIGGSLGGMQVLQWALDHPGELQGAVLVCATARLSAQNIAFSAVAREAIMRDPDFNGGDFYDGDARPDLGLSLARMVAHITYLSEASMREKFGRRLQNGDTPRYGFDVDFQVESYLQHQGQTFLRRFDANTYLYLTRVMDYFDPFGEPGALARLEEVRTRFLCLSFDSDWRFDTSHTREIVRHLSSARVPVTFREIASPWGHDSFLLEVPEYHRTVAAFLHRLEAEAVHGVPALAGGGR